MVAEVEEYKTVSDPVRGQCIYFPGIFMKKNNFQNLKYNFVLLDYVGMTTVQYNIISAVRVCKIDR